MTLMTKYNKARISCYGISVFKIYKHMERFWFYSDSNSKKLHCTRTYIDSPDENYLIKTLEFFMNLAAVEGLQ